MHPNPLSQIGVDKTRLLVAAIATAGAGLIALNPINPTTEPPSVQHRAVQLTAGDDALPTPPPEVTLTEFLTNTQANLTALESAATTANTELSTASNSLSNLFGGEITTAINNFDTGVQNAIDGGFYGGDDGYVEGLFPGVINSGPEAPYTSVGTLAEISGALSSGNYEAAYNYYNLFSLEALDHTLKPLLAPLLDQTSHGVTAYPLSIPVALSQLQTNVLEQFGNYNELKSLADATLAPEIGVSYGLTQDLGRIGTELASGDYSDASTNFNNLSSDLLNDLFNGFSTGSGEGEGTFTGLLNTGSLLQELLVTYPTQLATALTQTVTESTAPVAAESVSATLPDLFSGLF